MVDRLRHLMRVVATSLHVPVPIRNAVKRGIRLVAWLAAPVRTRILMRVNGRKARRLLEIGSGDARIPGFETLDVFPGLEVDYVLNGGKSLPFADGTFDLIYASHVLEHIPWYHTERVLQEWIRMLKPGGHLELWVPDGLKICETLLKAETTGVNDSHLDGWYRFNPHKDPCVWAAGRLFTYGDGTANTHHPNWHRALFTERYLRSVMQRAGLIALTNMVNEDVRGHDHGWISLGVRGEKSLSR